MRGPIHLPCREVARRHLFKQDRDLVAKEHFPTRFLEQPLGQTSIGAHPYHLDFVAIVEDIGDRSATSQTPSRLLVTLFLLSTCQPLSDLYQRSVITAFSNSLEMMYFSSTRHFYMHGVPFLGSMNCIQSILTSILKVRAGDIPVSTSTHIRKTATRITAC